MKQTEKKSKRTSIKGIISSLESLLETEIDRLPETLQEVAPEKRLDFITKTLPVVVKYRDEHTSPNWELPDWE